MRSPTSISATQSAGTTSTWLSGAQGSMRRASAARSTQRMLELGPAPRLAWPTTIEGRATTIGRSGNRAASEVSVAALDTV